MAHSDYRSGEHAAGGDGVGSGDAGWWGGSGSGVIMEGYVLAQQYIKEQLRGRHDTDADEFLEELSASV
jgi:hypothetical protein